MLYKIPIYSYKFLSYSKAYKMALIIENSSILKFNASKNVWEGLHTSNLLSEGSVVLDLSTSLLIIGGHGVHCSNKVYSLASESLTECTPMLSCRSRPSAILIHSNVYIIGGINTDSNESLVSCELLNTVTQKWSTLPHLKHARISPSLCFNNDWIYAMGGIGSEMIERLNVFGKTWQVLEISVFLPASELGLVNVGADRVLLLGGREENGLEISDVWLYDFGKECISQQSSLNSACAVLGISQSGSSLQIYGRNQVVEYTLPAEEPDNYLNIHTPEQSHISYTNKHVERVIKTVLPESPHVLVVKKLSCERVIEEHYQQCIEYLESRGCVVYTELNHSGRSSSTIFSQENSRKIDLVVTLGGDGTVIWASKLFCGAQIPPVIAFNLGTLGFMAKFSSDSIISTLSEVLDSHNITLEAFSQLHYRINDKGTVFQGDCTNDLYVDKGPSPCLIELEVYLDGEYCTTIVGGGVIVATPCGSTAYSLSAGGPITHHCLPSILITPISPHALSCRPLVLPDSIKIALKVPADARVSGWVCIDGSTRYKLSPGTTIEICISELCIPCNIYIDIVLDNTISHWISRLRDTLGWNNRRRQNLIKTAPSL